MLGSLSEPSNRPAAVAECYAAAQRTDQRMQVAQRTAIRAEASVAALTATLAPTLDCAAASPGVVVRAPDDCVGIVIGNAALVAQLGMLRAILDDLVMEQADEAELTVQRIMSGRPWNADELARAISGYIGVSFDHAAAVTRVVPARWYASPGFRFGRRDRQVVVAAIVDPGVDALCRAWPSLLVCELRDTLRPWIALWANHPAEGRHRYFLERIDNWLHDAVHCMRFRDGRWAPRTRPTINYNMIPVPDVHTAIANLDHVSAGRIQCVDDPEAETRWLCERDNLVVRIKDQPMRGLMERFVNTHSEGSMLVSRDTTALQALSPDTKLRITPRALKQLVMALAENADPPEAFVDISMAAMVGIITELAEPAGSRAAKAHLHAWLGLLPGHDGCGFDGEVDLMATRCDRRVLAEVQSLRDDFRASQIEARASLERMEAIQLEAQARLMASQLETQALVAQLAGRSNPDIGDLLIRHEDAIVARMIAHKPTMHSSPGITLEQVPSEPSRPRKCTLAPILYELFDINPGQQSWKMFPEEIEQVIKASKHANRLGKVGAGRALAHLNIHRKPRQPYRGIRRRV
jgi:hypothetical protein